MGVASTGRAGPAFRDLRAAPARHASFWLGTYVLLGGPAALSPGAGPSPPILCLRRGDNDNVDDKKSFGDFPGGTVVRNLPAMQGIRVRALVPEDPTCRGATKPVPDNY